MNKEAAFGLFLMALLLGGVLLLARRPTAVASYDHGHNYSQKGNVRVVPIDQPPRYKNKETRRIEYNADGLPTLIEITRDYAIT